MSYLTGYAAFIRGGGSSREARRDWMGSLRSATLTLSTIDSEDRQGMSSVEVQSCVAHLAGVLGSNVLSSPSSPPHPPEEDMGEGSVYAGAMDALLDRTGLMEVALKGSHQSTKAIMDVSCSRLSLSLLCRLIWEIKRSPQVEEEGGGANTGSTLTEPANLAHLGTTSWLRVIFDTLRSSHSSRAIGEVNLLKALAQTSISLPSVHWWPIVTRRFNFPLEGSIAFSENEQQLRNEQAESWRVAAMLFCARHSRFSPSLRQGLLWWMRHCAEEEDSPKVLEMAFGEALLALLREGGLIEEGSMEVDEEALSSTDPEPQETKSSRQSRLALSSLIQSRVVKRRRGVHYMNIRSAISSKQLEEILDPLLHLIFVQESSGVTRLISSRIRLITSQVLYQASPLHFPAQSRIEAQMALARLITSYLPQLNPASQSWPFIWRLVGSSLCGQEGGLRGLEALRTLDHVLYTRCMCVAIHCEQLDPITILPRLIGDSLASEDIQTCLLTQPFFVCGPICSSIAMHAMQSVGRKSRGSSRPDWESWVIRLLDQAILLQVKEAPYGMLIHWILGPVLYLAHLGEKGSVPGLGAPFQPLESLLSGSYDPSRVPTLMHGFIVQRVLPRQPKLSQQVGGGEEERYIWPFSPSSLFFTHHPMVIFLSLACSSIDSSICQGRHGRSGRVHWDA